MSHRPRHFEPSDRIPDHYLNLPLRASADAHGFATVKASTWTSNAPGGYERLVYLLLGVVPMLAQYGSLSTRKAAEVYFDTTLPRTGTGEPAQGRIWFPQDRSSRNMIQFTPLFPPGITKIGNAPFLTRTSWIFNR